MLDDVNHGQIACVTCHGGDPEAETRATAHIGLKADPSWTDTQDSCGGCHQDIVTDVGNSLHTTLAGLENAVIVRSATDSLVHAGLETAFSNHCSKCHSSCGNCHISVPASAGGGLLRKHKFIRTPSPTLVCMACHGSRVADEFRGHNEGYPADIHYSRGMACTDCHNAAEMHGTDSGDPQHRYAVTNKASCDNCHEDNASFREVTAHNIHRDSYDQMTISCQVCHSVAYKSCTACHVSLNDSGAPIYEVNAANNFDSTMNFKIGFNPLQDSLHPNRWVLLRHVPADANNFDYYGADLQPGFDNAETWRMATPHNIQKSTPQNSSCMFSCHAHRELFLSSDDVAPEERTANAGVIVPDEAIPQQ